MTMQPSHTSSEARLRALAIEICVLQEELAALTVGPRSVTDQRDINHLRARLQECQSEWQLAQLLWADRSSFDAGPLEAKPVKATDPWPDLESATFQQALNVIVSRMVSSPASLRMDHQILVEEGHPAPEAEVVQDIRDEILYGLMMRTSIDADALTPLQETYLGAMCQRLVSHALRGTEPVESILISPGPR